MWESSLIPIFLIPSLLLGALIHRKRLMEQAALPSRRVATRSFSMQTDEKWGEREGMQEGPSSPKIQIRFGIGEWIDGTDRPTDQIPRTFCTGSVVLYR